MFQAFRYLSWIITDILQLVLQLNTVDCTSLDASFVEAVKTSFTIETLPPVLLIQLKHWKLNTQTRSFEKVTRMIFIMPICLHITADL